ncbi:hypothetical protein E4U41_005214, partial [Claviceps citrina]
MLSPKKSTASSFDIRTLLWPGWLYLGGGADVDDEDDDAEVDADKLSALQGLISSYK